MVLGCLIVIVWKVAQSLHECKHQQIPAPLHCNLCESKNTAALHKMSVGTAMLEERLGKMPKDAGLFTPAPYFDKIVITQKTFLDSSTCHSF